MKKAFTLLELIVVIVIIGILAGVSITKLHTNKKDAQITVIRDIISNAKKGIEAYAANQILSTGMKEYPQSLCNGKGNCTENSHLFYGLINNAIPHNKIADKQLNFVFWDSGKTVMILDSKTQKKGYALSYDSNTGSLTCVNDWNRDGYTSLPCKNIGE